jgi:type III secretion system YscQ/HrcQ family protein
MRGDLSSILTATALWNACVASLIDGLPLQGRGRALLRLSPETAPDDSPLYELSTRDGPVWLQLRRLPLGVMTRSTLTQADLADLPPALAEAVLSLALDALGTAAGPAVQDTVTATTRTDPSVVPAGTECILADLDAGWGEPAELLLMADRAVWTSLICSLMSDLPRPALPEAIAARLPVNCGLRLCGRDLRQVRLSQLRPGDIILPEAPALSLWAPHARFALAQDGSNWTITEVAMTDEFPETPAHGTAEDAPAPDIGSLPVRLSFLLAEQTLTLADLQSLAKGAILPFQPELPQPGHSVRILANGRAIGHGNVVEVEGQPAIRIARLFSTE